MLKALTSWLYRLFFHSLVLDYEKRIALLTDRVTLLYEENMELRTMLRDSQSSHIADLRKVAHLESVIGDLDGDGPRPITTPSVREKVRKARNDFLKTLNGKEFGPGAGAYPFLLQSLKTKPEEQPQPAPNEEQADATE